MFLTNEELKMFFSFQEDKGHQKFIFNPEILKFYLLLLILGAKHDEGFKILKIPKGEVPAYAEWS